ncbi:MAG TPA: hypothetical protein VIG08_05500 [Gemmatimonadales bacterium]|jgi:hypothetical protein
MRRWIGGVLVLAACGGGTTGGAGDVRPAGSAASAVTEFLRAVSDSNLDKMAMLWGTTAGPSGRTKQPQDYERRIATMQAYLRHDDSRIVTDSPDAVPTRHAVQAELRRAACTWTVPFEVIQIGDGSWIVNKVDVATAGNPARPCSPNAPTTAPDSAPAPEQ